MRNKRVKNDPNNIAFPYVTFNIPVERKTKNSRLIKPAFRYNAIQLIFVLKEWFISSEINTERQKEIPIVNEEMLIQL